MNPDHFTIGEVATLALIGAGLFVGGFALLALAMIYL